MRTWAKWIFALTALGALTSAVSADEPDFGDCSSAAYRGSFDPRLAEVEYDCVERLRVPVSTRSGQRYIRIVHDRNADWIVSSAEMAEFDRGVRGAAEAFARLGGVDLAHVTLLLADDFPPREGARGEFSNMAAYTNFDSGRDGECRIVLYLAGPGSTPEYAAFVAAHEIFHCVQLANLSPEQMSSGSEGLGGGGDWWMEGSANWFAGLSIPDTAPFAADIAAFESDSPTTPLNRMAYGAVVFFFWLGGDMAPGEVMMFLSGMAPSRADSAQRAAMASALPQERWLDFAEAYLDGEIRYPSGAPLTLSPQQGEIWEWSATQTRTAPLDPFVLHRGVLAFQCGRWMTSVTPGAAHSARMEDGGAWNLLPNSIDTTSGSGGNYRFAAINTGGTRSTLSVQGRMEAGCGDCAGIVELDACVVGSWRMTGGGAAEWMRRQGVPGNYSTSNETITFRRDGTFVTGLVGLESHARLRDGGRADGEGQVQAGGRWSAAEGRLNLCADMQLLQGQTVLTTRDGQRVVIPTPSAPPGNSQMSYTCSQASLRTVIPLPGAPPMPAEYTRIGD